MRARSGGVGQGVLLADVALELDEFLGDVVVVALREDAQYRPARLVHLDALAQEEPRGARALLDDALELEHRHADQPVLPGEAVVFDADVQLVKVELRLLRTDDAVDVWTELGFST